MSMKIGIRAWIDFAFRKIYGKPGNDICLISLLNAVLQFVDPVVSVEYLNPFGIKDFETDKLVCVDVKATEQRGEQRGKLKASIQIYDKNQRGQASLMVEWRLLWVGKSLIHPTRLLVVIATKHCFRGTKTLESDLQFESKRPDPFDRSHKPVAFVRHEALERGGFLGLDGGSTPNLLRSFGSRPSFAWLTRALPQCLPQRRSGLSRHVAIGWCANALTAIARKVLPSHCRYCLAWCPRCYGILRRKRIEATDDPF
jgi:hypothetical protein